VADADSSDRAEKAKGTIGSPYAVKDFYAINPDYGTSADLKRLVSESHRRGMKVIIDIVANHTAWDSVMMKTKALLHAGKSGEIIPPDRRLGGRRGSELRQSGTAKIHDRDAQILGARIRSGRFSLRRRRFRADRFLGNGARRSR
jgi:hypothetical protein